MKTVLAVLLPLVLSACVVVPVENEGKSAGGSATLCHKGKKTMELPRDAVQAHLDHGDRMGPC